MREEVVHTDFWDLVRPWDLLKSPYCGLSSPAPPRILWNSQHPSALQRHYANEALTLNQHQHPSPLLAQDLCHFWTSCLILMSGPIGDRWPPCSANAFPWAGSLKITVSEHTCILWSWPNAPWTAILLLSTVRYLLKHLLCVGVQARCSVPVLRWVHLGGKVNDLKSFLFFRCTAGQCCFDCPGYYIVRHAVGTLQIACKISCMAGPILENIWTAFDEVKRMTWDQVILLKGIYKCTSNLVKLN